MIGNLIMAHVQVCDGVVLYGLDGWCDIELLMVGQDLQQHPQIKTTTENSKIYMVGQDLQQHPQVKTTNREFP